MVSAKHRITIISGPKRPGKELNDELRFLGRALGLISLRDKDSSCYRVFIEMVKVSKADRAFTSDELAARMSLTRGTVVYHLTKLIESGLVVSDRNRYMMRADTLQAVISEMERDAIRIFEDLERVAKKIDVELGLD